MKKAKLITIIYHVFMYTVFMYTVYSSGLKATIFYYNYFNQEEPIHSIGPKDTQTFHRTSLIHQLASLPAETSAKRVKIR